MEVVLYENKYIDPILEFIKKVWDKDITAVKFISQRTENISKNPYGNEGGAPIIILVEDKKVLGHIAATPCKLKVMDKEILAYWLSGLHVLDECRGKGVAKLLPLKMQETFSIVTGFWVIEASSKIFRKLGWKIPGKLPEFLKILNTKKFFSQIDLHKINHAPNYMKKIFKKENRIIRSFAAITLSWTININKKFWNSISFRTKPQVICREVSQFDSRVDDLWDRNAIYLKFAQVRKSDYLNWQFNSKQGWIKVIAENHTEILGYAIISENIFSKDDRLAGLRAMSIIDLFWEFQQPAILHHLIDYIETKAKLENTDILLCSINCENAQKVLKKMSFIKIPSSVYFGFHYQEEKIQLSDRIEDWFLTRGDADAAGSLSPSSILI